MKDLWKMIDILEDDIKVIAKFLVDNQRTGALERSYIRACFATIEGILYVFRQEMIKSSEFEKKFTKKERAFILDRKYDKKNDVVKSEAMYPPLKDSVKYITRYFAAHRGIADFKFPETKGWQDLLESIKLRDSLMHPKKTNDIEITNANIEMVLRSKTWFKKEVMGQFV